jgi:hypothetical protein
MSNTLTSVIKLLLSPAYSGPFGSLAPQLPFTLNMQQGTGANQADLGLYRAVSVTSGTPNDADLNAGGLLNVDGSAFSAAKITAFAFINDDATNNLTIGGTGNTFSTWLTGTNPGVVLGPGGILIVVNPSLAAYGVTPSTGDTLRSTASAGTVAMRNVLMGRTV